MPPLTTSLAHLKAMIYNLTGITPENQKLIASGAILKDDLAPLSSFGIFNSKAPAAASSNGEAKRLKAIALTELGERQISAIARNYYLSAAQNLLRDLPPR